VIPHALLGTLTHHNDKAILDSPVKSGNDRRGMWIPTRVTVVMSLQGRVTTEAISYLIEIIEIATKREALLAMTNQDCAIISERI
jgi:hypothetical protein